MAELVSHLSDFEGFGVQYDPSKNPYFRKIMEENLTLLRKVAVGKDLLNAIAAARPAARGDFPRSINVMCTPQPMNFTQSGYKREAYFPSRFAKVTGMTPSDSKRSPDGCPFWLAESSMNEAVDRMNSTNRLGTVCYMWFSNVQVITSRGERTEPHIVLAHELIHSMHCLEGIKIDGDDEELWTTGLDPFKSSPISENQFRRAFGIKLREQYY